MCTTPLNPRQCDLGVPLLGTTFSLVISCLPESYPTTRNLAFPATLASWRPKASPKLMPVRTEEGNEGCPFKSHFLLKASAPARASPQTSALLPNVGVTLS